MLGRVLCSARGGRRVHVCLADTGAAGGDGVGGSAGLGFGDTDKSLPATISWLARLDL